MSFLKWKRYEFFNTILVKDSNGDEFTYLKDRVINCASSGRTLLVFGDDNGVIHTITRKLEVSTFQAFKHSVEHIQQMRQNSILVAIGTDEVGINPVVKVWDQEKMNMQAEPYCNRVFRAVIGLKPALVSAFRVNDNMTAMACGFDDGRLLIVRGDITRTANQLKQTSSSVAPAPITGIEFSGSGHIFVATTISVHLVILGPANGEPTITQLGSDGAKQECCTVSEVRRDHKEAEFIIGSDKALRVYKLDGIGPCFGFDQEKVLLRWFQNYLVCVNRDNDNTILRICDTHNRYVAHSIGLQEITQVLTGWGGRELVVVTKSGRIFKFTERSIEDRLGILFRKNQYELAMSIAHHNNYEGIVDICRQYGDHLYAKGEHGLAVQQYIKTIGKLEESYVIRKLLDAHKIEQLTVYLQELHKQGVAKEDHTTLLINCYTNIKNVEKLSEFIKTLDLQFDAEIAIKVCRSGELYAEALYLAEKHQKTDYYLKIQLENMRNYEQAIDYIQRLPFAVAEEYVEKYGKVLMDNCPQLTTSLLCKLCTNFEGRKSPAEKFIHIFVNNLRLLKEFLQQIIAELGNKVDLSSIIYNTLLELELQEFESETQPHRRAAKELEIMCFLKEKKNCYDTDLALGLCQINNFKQGILHLYEKTELYHRILSFYTEKKDYEKIVDLCKRFGDNDSTLWLHALHVFATGDANQYFMQVLEFIEERNLYPAIMVVSIAARSETATLSLVKEYLVRHLSSEGKVIRDCEQSIKKLKLETDLLRKQMDESEHEARVFQESKCAGCKIELELPSVHFLCKHSFHVNCFENFSDSSGCPSCAPENSRIAEQQRQMDAAMATLTEDFTRTFSATDDVLGTVAEFMAKGVFKTNEPWKEQMPPREIVRSSQPVKSLFEKPSSFPSRLVTAEPATRSIFDKPAFYERPEKRWSPKKPVAKVQPRSSPLKKPTESLNPFGDEESVASSLDENNPFKESAPKVAPAKPVTSEQTSNPFGDDEDEGTLKESTPTNQTKSTNPFGDDEDF